MAEESTIRSGQSSTTDPGGAVREFRSQVWQDDAELVMFFCSTDYDLEALGEEMGRAFAGIQVVGCTSAGVFGPGGYVERGISGASFPAREFCSASRGLQDLQRFAIGSAQALVQSLLKGLETRPPQTADENCFAFLLIDGLSVREEPVARALQHALGGIPLVGGSAGDGLRFGKTHVYFEGRFHTDSAVLCLIRTPVLIKTFKTQHFVATDERLVVTEADTARRIVREINGLPAVEEYARILGVESSELDPMRFAAWPVVVMIDGTNYVRSIQKANPDGSLTFFCAIEDGVVLRVARGVDLLENLEETFRQIRSEIGQPQAVLGCDCILRKLEISQGGLGPQVEEILLRNSAVGLNTYGEQFRGVHVNQTFTGVAVGPGRNGGRNA